MKPIVTISRTMLLLTILLILFQGFTGIGAAQSISKSLIGDVAIKGYDTVAYFKDGKALKGKESISFPWRNANWYFTTSENRDLFAAAPEKYAPQYGGYCAWAMSEDRKAVTDPEVWKIVGGKLYLNCSRSAMEKWERDIPGNIIKADTNWRKHS